MGISDSDSNAGGELSVVGICVRRLVLGFSVGFPVVGSRVGCKLVGLSVGLDDVGFVVGQLEGMLLGGWVVGKGARVADSSKLKQLLA